MAFVVIGGGLAGGKAVETLREEGYAGRIVLVTAEPERPYERPPLSKGLLLGSAERDSVHVHGPDWYAEHDVDLRTGTTATAIDRAAHTVLLGGGDAVAYEKLLLATGSRPRTLRAEREVLTLRTLADADRIAAALRPGTRLVIVGAGWIGLQIASAARRKDVAVSVIARDSLPLRRVLGDEMAEVFADLHRSHGVDFHFDAEVERIGEAVRLTDGTELPADTVLVAVGAIPETGLASSAGLAVGDGIQVDACLRTSDPDIFAAGDVAEVEHPRYGTRVRVEHWANALNTGPVAARAMLGQDVTYDEIPYFFTDQYDLGMEYSGWIPPGTRAEVVVRGDLKSREFVAFWLVDGIVAAGMNVNVWDVSDPIRSLIGTRVDPARLTDTSIPIEELAR